MATPENKVKQKINEVLDRYKEYLYVFMPVPYGYGRSTLDYLGFVCGHGFAIEAKRPGEKPTPRQELIIKLIEDRSNTPVFVIDGENGELENLDSWLELRTSLRLTDAVNLTSLRSEALNKDVAA